MARHRPRDQIVWNRGPKRLHPVHRTKCRDGRSIPAPSAGPVL